MLLLTGSVTQLKNTFMKSMLKKTKMQDDLAAELWPDLELASNQVRIEIHTQHENQFDKITLTGMET